MGAGFKLYTYETGTSTPLATYSDTSLSIANTNPIIADSTGRFIQTFIGDAKLYKLELKDADDNLIWTADPVDPKVFSLDDFDPRPTSFWGTTSGTSSAYTLTADPVVASYSDTQTFYLDFHIACAASPTLSYVDGGAALNLKKKDGAGGKLSLEAGDVLTGTYEARNDGTDIIILNPEKPTLIKTSSGAELTIATGAITITHTNHSIRGEGAAVDTLATITGGVSGQILVLSIGSASEAITFDSGAGNIICPNGFDVTINDINQRVRLEYDGSNWVFMDIKLAGDIVQVVNTQTGAVATGTTQIPYDDSPPQNTEGDQYMTHSITPTSATNRLKIDVIFNGHNSGNVVFTVALFQDSTASAIDAASTVASGNSVESVPLSYYMTAGTTSSTTFKVRAGPSTATTVTFNGAVTARKYGGVNISSITITEIQV